MRKLTMSAGIAVVAIALTAPFALAKTDPNPATTPTTASSPGNASDLATMYTEAQPLGPAEAQRQSRTRERAGGFDSSMMSGHRNGDYGSAMMRGYGPGWMGAYGRFWVPTLLVILVVGIVVWIFKQNPGNRTSRTIRKD